MGFALTNRKRSNIQCEWLANPNKGWLQSAWSDLEQHSSSSFFLSWLWIGTWLECFVDDFVVVEARRYGKTVGLGVLVTKPINLTQGQLRRKHYLHRTGINDEDQIWTEYNDFLIADRDADEVRTAMFSYIASRMEPLDTLLIGACNPEQYAHIDEVGLSKRVVWETTNYFLELEPLRKSHTTLLKSISRNSRYQISRSLRKYREIGEVCIDQMDTIEDSVALLKIAEPFHFARWGKSINGSGLANPKFVDFHKRLISKGLDSGVIELSHIRAGEETIGVVYNFRYRDTVYFYFCAMNYSHSDPQLKPGLVSHYLLIEKAIAEGAEVYDFMGGVARYKATFANVQGKLEVYQFEQPGLIPLLENRARELKHRLQDLKS